MISIPELHKLFLECSCRLTTDSRVISGGEIFIALKGENFDGSAFALQSLEKGAAYAVVNDDSDAAKSGDARILTVNDTLKALQGLACYHRENTLHDGLRIPMLALTGTNGKTTTKELIKAVLSRKYNLVATEGNLNNNIGVPLTLLRLRPETEMAVVEMGASHFGDIKELVDIAHPDFGLITNVGKAHLLGFGSLEGVMKTKGEMYDYIRSAGGKCFVNSSNELLMKMVSERGDLRTVFYGMKEQDCKVFDTPEHTLRLTFNLDGRECDVKTNLVGSYNAENVLCAVAVGRFFGVSADDALEAVSSYVPSNKRSQVRRTERNTLVLDAYNANPTSMAASLENFIKLESGKKMVCLGDMLELGEESVNEHVKILQIISSAGFDSVLLVGDEFRKALEQHPLDAALHFETSALASDYLKANAPSGATILIKGSHGTRMDILENVL